jgi:outer membrane receptor protein involved in Fe transport
LSGGFEIKRDRLYVESYAIFSDTPEPGTDTLKHSSAYAQLEWAVSPKWELEAGVRYTDATWESKRLDPNPLSNELLTESQDKDRALPRFNVKFKPAHAWTLRLLAGATLRVPESVMSEVCCGQRYQRNANTLAETGETWGFEGTYQPSPDLRANLYLARSDFDDYIMRVPGWSEAYIQTYALANVAEARADTAEIAVRWSPTSLVTFDASFGWLSFKSREVERVTLEIDQMSGATPAYLVVDRIPYLPVRTASISGSLSLPRGGSITLGGAYTGKMLVHWFDPDNPQELPPGFPIFLNNGLQEEPRWTDGFWLVNLSAEIPIRHGFDLVAAVNNMGDYIQTDLGDPATDYNWGPLNGTSWRIGLKYHFDR